MPPLISSSSSPVQAGSPLPSDPKTRLTAAGCRAHDELITDEDRKSLDTSLSSLIDHNKTEIRAHAEALNRLGSLDWNDTLRVSDVARDVLMQVASDRPAMIAALAQLAERPEMFARCEMDDFFYRIVLAEDHETGVSLRLHFLKSNEREQPHNHRATFASLLLSGGYRHSLYQVPDEFMRRTDGQQGRPGISPAEILQLRPSHTRYESAGSYYALHHSAFHTTIPTADHISLVARGPSSRRRLLIFYQEERRAEWLYGGVDETPQQLLRKKLPVETYQGLVSRVERVI